MKDIKITDNHPVKKRKTLGPIGRFLLKLVNWNIVGNLPDKKRIIIASAPHSSTFDSIYAYFVCLAVDLKFYFLGSVSMFTRIVVPLPFKKNPDKLGIPHPFGKIQNKLLLEFGGIPVWRAKSTGVTQQVIEQLETKEKFILYLTVEGEMKTNETIKMSYDVIMDKVFRLEEGEKRKFTQRLDSMTDEQRDVNVVMKINKLEEWGY